MSGRNDSKLKLYVGGLPGDTTDESLRGHFERFGEITDCVVMFDKSTGKPRGFGFVTFGQASSMHVALGTSNRVGGRDVIVKRAVKEAPPAVGTHPGGIYNVKKIFVGGLPSTCDFEQLVSYFGRFGRIEDAVVMMDPQTQKHRGFGYVTFNDSSSVEAALDRYSDHRIDGKWVEVKRCIPQDAMRVGGGSSSSRRAGERSRGEDGRGRDARDGRSGCQPQAMGPVGMYNPYADPYAQWYGAGYGPTMAYYGMYPPVGPDPYYMPPAFPMYMPPAYGPITGPPPSMPLQNSRERHPGAARSRRAKPYD